MALATESAKENSSSGPSDPPPRKVRRGFIWSRLGIQSKLLTMLLVVSIFSTLIAGYFGYRSGSDALEDAAYDQLTAVRDARAREINSFFVGMRRSVVLNSLNATTTQAMDEFTQGFDELQGVEPTAEEHHAIHDYYATKFLPGLRENVEGLVTTESFEPTSNAATYLQAKYTVPPESFDDAIKVNNAGDGSLWSLAHSRYHSFFREVVLQNSFEDAMLIDTRGNVVYTAYKGVDLGTNILTGPYKDSALEAAYKDVLRTNAVNAVALTDFEPYIPSYDVPTAFGLSPIGDNGELAGVLVIQLPVQSINNVMTTNQEWDQAGQGQTGETFLVGPDGLMRSTSRQLFEDPEVYRDEVVDAGTSTSTADTIVARGSPILEQSVDSESVEQALRGRTGTTVEENYLGKTVLTSYSPIEQEGLNWVVISQVEEDEALAPVDDFLRTLALTTLAIVLLVTLASMWMARVFSRPVNQLVTAVRQVAGGDLDTRVRLKSRDEFQDLAVAFNDMSASLRNKQELLDQQMLENDRMLYNLMPESVAKRYRTGEENITDEHQDVSVLFATLDGFDEFGIGLDHQESVALLNQLVRGFDVAAERTGVERVRTLRSGYIASCGLVIRRVDHVLRIIDFAQEMQDAVARFNAQHDADISLRAGIDTGTVTSGLVGGGAVYDMWGDSVTLAYGVQAVTSAPGVYVSQNVYEKARDTYSFTAVGPVQIKNIEQPVWLLEEGDGHG